MTNIVFLVLSTLRKECRTFGWSKTGNEVDVQCITN
jgi:hypothetical protein